MTPAERARRHRAKLHAQHKLYCAETVLAALDRDYVGASATDKQILRRGVARLLRKWEREWARVEKALKTTRSRASSATPAASPKGAPAPEVQ
jgi:hypothetical protein